MNGVHGGERNDSLILVDYRFIVNKFYSANCCSRNRIGVGHLERADPFQHVNQVWNSRNNSTVQGNPTISEGATACAAILDDQADLVFSEVSGKHCYETLCV